MAKASRRESSSPEAAARAYVRAAERADRKALDSKGKSLTTGATGQTLIKLYPGPIKRLIQFGKVGPLELQVAADYEKAFMAIAGSLLIKPLTWERQDRTGNAADWPPHLVDAVARYNRVVACWSLRKKVSGDPVQEVVTAAVIDERPLSAIDDDLRCRNGTASRLLVAGLREYAARVGWYGREESAEAQKRIRLAMGLWEQMRNKPLTAGSEYAMK